MKFGCVFPTVEIGNDPGAIRDWIQTAEGLGYDHIIVYDHVLGAVHADRTPALWGPYDETHPFHEPMVLLGFMAGITTHIDMMTGVLISPQRQGVLVAKQAAEIALLSNGRFRLGVGTGWNPVEYDALGMSFADRGAVLDEQVDVWRRLWSGDVIEFHGDHHQIDRANCQPTPPGPIPIWFGGSAPASLRRAATVGDGYLFGSSGDRALGAARDLRARLAAHGRDDHFGLDALVGFGDGPDVWHDRIASWASVDADAVSVRTMTASSALVGETDPGFTTAREHIDALATFMAAVRD